MPGAVLTDEDLVLLQESPRQYAADILWIRTKPRPGRPSELDRFEYNWAQDYVDRKVEEQRSETGRIRVLVLKARQLGMSTQVAGRIYQGCTLWPRRRGLVLADELDRAGEIFGIYERFNDHAALKPLPKTTRKARELAWQTDSRLTVGTARDIHSGRSATLDYVHASEFALWPYPADTLAGLLDAMPADAGEFWIESTAQGVGNEFHSMWLEAEAGESEWLAIFLPWFLDPGYRWEIDETERAEIVASTDEYEREAQDVGFPFDGEMVKLSPEQLAWRRRKIREGGALKFRQENPSTAEEAFIVSGDPFFDTEGIKALLKAASPPVQRGMLVRKDSGIFIVKSPKGSLRVWELPNEDMHYAIAADTAEGKLAAKEHTSLSDPEGERGGRDFCSADVVRLGYTDSDGVNHPPRMVAHLHDRLEPEIFAEQLYALGYLYSCRADEGERTFFEPSLLGIERNHDSGQAVIRKLKDLGYPRLYAHRRVNVRTQRPTMEVGFVTDADTRPAILYSLAERVRLGTIEIPNKETINELLTFVRNDAGRPEAQADCHDDRVMSLAITNEMSRHHRHSAPPIEDFDDRRE
jgi:hypothetical protein